MTAIANTNNEIPLTVEQGADFSYAFPAAVDVNGNPIDISGYTASMKIRSSPPTGLARIRERCCYL